MSTEKKKHYMMGDTSTSEDQKKEIVSARNESLDNFKTLLEKQGDSAKAEDLDVEKLIASFPYSPHQDRLVVLPHSSEKKLPSGIIIPDSVTEKPQGGVIIAMGEETSLQHKILEHLIAIRKTFDHDFHSDLEPAFSVHKLGDTVVFGKFAGAEIEVDTVKYIVLRFADIWATCR